MKLRHSEIAPRLSLAQMRLLVEIVASGRFSVAAKRLGVSQPSVSNALRSLEAAYRVRLIERGASAAPTPLLTSLLPKMRAILAMADGLETSLQRQQNLAAGKLRLCYSTHQLAMPLVSRFIGENPGVELEARSLASLDILPEIEGGRADIGMITARDAPPMLESRLVASTSVVMVVRKTDRLSHRPSVDWDTVSRQRLLLRETGSATRQIFEGAAQLARAPLTIAVALGSWEAITMLVHSGAGVGIAMAAEVSPSDNLDTVPIDDPGLRLNHYAVYRREMAQVAAVKAFCDLL